MKPVALAFLIAVCLTPLCGAEAGPAEDPFARYLFPPDRVMARAQDIDLDDAQRAALRGEVQKAQPRFLDFQFAMQDEMGKVARLLQEKPVDEAKVLSAIDRVLALERDVKRLQVSLLVRIKNLLTAAQQTKLAELERAGR